ncbi:MAG: hypothetical protein ACWA49_14295 [Ruegeria sp.]
MKAFLAAVATMAIITAAAPFALKQLGHSSAVAEASPSVRLD